MNRFGVRIKILRDQHKLLQREVAAKLSIDSAMLSKIECGTRRAKRVQVIMLAEVFNVDIEELLSLWLGEKIYDVLKEEEFAKKALKVAEKEVNYNIKNRNGR